MTAERLTDRLDVRRFGAGDSVEELTSLLRTAYRELADMGLRYVATWQDEEITRDRIGRAECFIALDRGELVGTIAFESAPVTRGCEYYDRPGVASFHQFAVAPDRQRRGVGSLLLRTVGQRASATGAEELALDTADEATHLIAFYERHGYRIVGRADWPDTNYESVIMAKSIPRPRA